MMKRRPYDRLFEGNILVLYCVIFTANIIFITLLSSVRGVEFTLNIRILVWMFVFLSAPLLPLWVFKRLWQSDRIPENSYIFWISIPAHYVISSGLTLIFVFIQGIFEPLPRIVYLYSLIQYTIMYAIVIVSAVIIDLMQTSKVNRNLQIIQKSKKRGALK
ncbi:MAG: hypothetical protein FWF78_09705 [Defluviitaleaceae bacterium]|nr:hypothetical protein [Defluviitaleaceae bacterium]